MDKQKPTVMKAYILRVKSGPQAGWYVGGRFGGGLVTNPEVQKNPPMNIPNSKYGLWAQEAAATRFFEHAMPDAVEELTKLGYEIDVIQVQ